jgi:hypothetical protein
MSKPSPYYHVIISKDDNEFLNCDVMVTFQKPDDMRYYTMISSALYRSIDDALFEAKMEIADFMGREWL